MDEKEVFIYYNVLALLTLSRARAINESNAAGQAFLV